MPTQPSQPDQTKYRQVQFIGGRILQSREVAAVQALTGDEPVNGSYGMGALFAVGATLNIQPAISGATVSLAPGDATQPMLVFLNNRWERITATSFTFPTAANGTAVSLFFNWVLWRVTSDGAQATIEDPTLIDSATQEQVAEMGQLQISIGADDSGSVNTQTMFGRNTAPIPALLFKWVSGALVWQGGLSGISSASASAFRHGLVAMSTADGNSTAVSTTDPTVTNSRNPNPGSVYTNAVGVPVVTGSGNLLYTDQNNVVQGEPYSFVSILSTSAGIDARRSFFATWSVTVHDALTFIANRTANCFTVLQSLIARIVALESKPTVNYSWHIGKNLGRAGTNIDTHPPIVDNTDPTTNQKSFKNIATTALQTASQAAASESAGAFDVVSQIGQRLGGVDFDGNYEYANASNSGNLVGTSGPNTVDFRKYYNFAKFMKDWINVPVLSTLLVDNPAAPGVTLGILDSNGNYQLLNPAFTAGLVANGFDFRSYYGFANSVISWFSNPPIPGTQLIRNVRLETTSNGTWVIITLGTGSGAGKGWEIAWGHGAATNGAQIAIPNGFTYQNFLGECGMGSVDTSTGNNLDHFHCNMGGSYGSFVTVNATDNSGHSFTCTANWTSFAWRYGF